MFSMKKVIGDPDDLAFLATFQVSDHTPAWFLAGVTSLGSIEDGLWKAGVWCEGKFVLGDLIKGFEVTEDISEEERERILKDAAEKALKICITEDNVADIGESLLDKHPECRKAKDTYTAIIEAALAERKAVFTEDMYGDP